MVKVNSLLIVKEARQMSEKQKEVQEDLEICPECKVGKMRPIGPTATLFDKEWKNVESRLTANKCDNCDYPQQGGKALTANVNEQVNITH